MIRRLEHIKTLYTNADQLVNKLDDLLLIIAQESPELIAITEVIPKAQVHPLGKATLSIPGYELFTNFDPEQPIVERKRGVAIYVTSSLEVSEFEVHCREIEHIWLKVTLGHNESLLVGCVYRSPSSDLRNSTNELCQTFRMVTGLAPPRLVVMGDFNYRDIDWNNWHVPSANIINKPQTDFITTLQECFLHQHVTEPTRHRPNQAPSLLDLIISNEEDLISNLQYQPGLWKSDHLCLLFNINCCPVHQPRKITLPNYDRGNYVKMNQELIAVEWEKELSSKDFSEAWQHFSNYCDNLMKANIPQHRPSTKKKNIYMNSEAMKSRKVKQEHWYNYINTPSELNYLRFTIARNNLRTLTRKLRRNHEAAIINQIKTNPKAFWKYVGTKTKSRSKINNLDKEDGTKATNDQDKANLLNNYFSSVFTVEDLNTIPVPPRYHAGQPLVNVTITTENVTLKLTKLLPGKSPGPDGWHPRILRELAPNIAKPLSILLQKSLKESHIPPSWKEGHITPIFKKGKKSSPANYRPVSLTSIISKIMESFLRDEIINHMSTHNLFADEQHGFVPGRSCVTQLLVVLEEWTEALEAGRNVDVIYLDFRKAFDSVPHQRLLCKLKAYGIGDRLYRWIESFLSNRSQRVTINGTKSDWVPVTSGIPQGSVLGPVLFVLYINDLPSVLRSVCRIFADDTKVFRAIISPEDTTLLQDDINKLSAWSAEWQLPFNTTKCKSLHLGRSNTNHTYSINNNPLEQISQEKDLGIIIDNKLKFHEHVSYAANKANSILAIIRKTFAALDSSAFKALYTTLVRPHLEYGNTIWGPTYALDCLAVERVQRRATELVPTIRHYTYTDRLKAIGLPSLHYRRKRGDMIQVYKLLNSKDRIDPYIFFTPSTSISTRGHDSKLFKPIAVKECRRRFFSVRVINSWNSLPQDTVSAPSVNSFKNRLDKFWAEIQYNHDMPEP